MALHKVNMKGLCLSSLVSRSIFSFSFSVSIEASRVRVTSLRKKVFCDLLSLIICVPRALFTLSLSHFISWPLLNFFSNKYRNFCYQVAYGLFFFPVTRLSTTPHSVSLAWIISIGYSEIKVKWVSFFIIFLNKRLSFYHILTKWWISSNRLVNCKRATTSPYLVY